MGKKKKSADDLTVNELISWEQRAGEGDKEAIEFLENLEGYDKTKFLEIQKLINDENGELVKEPRRSALDAILKSTQERALFEENLLKKAVGLDKFSSEISKMANNLESNALDTFKGIADNSAAEMARFLTENKQPDLLGLNPFEDSFSVPIDFLSHNPNEQMVDELRENNELQRENNARLKEIIKVLLEQNTQQQQEILEEKTKAQEKAKQMEIPIPSRPADLQRWKIIWREAKILYEREGMTLSEIVTRLKTKRPNLKVAKDTLRKVITAGQAGELD